MCPLAQEEGKIMPVRKRKGQSIRPPNHRRPFKGDTPRNVKQTIDVGAGDYIQRIYEITQRDSVIPYMERQAQKYPRRSYVAIDPLVPQQRFLLRNLTLLQGFAEQVLPELVSKGIKTRYLNLDMPYPLETITGYYSMDAHQINGTFRRYFSSILETAPRLLLPNGKIFLQTEKKEFVQIARVLARLHGFSFREKKPMPWVQKLKHSRATRSFEREPIYRVELTYRLKTALPNKKDRKNWPSR